MFESSDIRIETERLILQPLSFSQLVKYRANVKNLEDELRLNYSNFTLPEELKNALDESIIPGHRRYSSDTLFFTLWIMIAKKENQMVGDLCFKTAPNEFGEVEIGYGTYPECMKKGYMTEAIQGVIKWAFRESRITTILAETENNNLASQKVLTRNHFIPFKNVENMIWWKLMKPELNNNSLLT